MKNVDAERLLGEIERLKSMVEQFRTDVPNPDAPVAASGRSAGDPEMTPQVAQLLQAAQNHMIEPAAREDGYTLVFTLVERHPGQEQTAIVSSASETDMAKILVPDDELVLFATAFANPARLKIMRELAGGQKSSAELSEATGLIGGQLYHHLKELAHSGFVEQKARNAYALTAVTGKSGYLGMSLLANTVRHAAERVNRG